MTAFRDAVFILALLSGAAGVNSMVEDFDHQVGDKAADFFKQTFGQESEQQTEENKELTDE
jgi:hypothetical protein